MVEFSIELFHFCFAIGRGGQCDAPVGMKMVDMRKWQKAMQRRIDRRGNRVIADGAERVHRHHVVFGVDSLVAALEREQLLLVERGKACALDAAKVAAGAFYPEHFNFCTGERICLNDLRTGVSACEVGDAQV